MQYTYEKQMMYMVNWVMNKEDQKACRTFALLILSCTEKFCMKEIRKRYTKIDMHVFADALNTSSSDLNIPFYDRIYKL